MLYRKGSTLFGEIHDQPRAWQGVLDYLATEREGLRAWLKSLGVGQVVYLATGESLGVAQSVSRMTHLVSGLNSVALPCSEVLYGRRAPYDARIKTLVVLLSRSHGAEEVGWGIEKLKALDPRATVLAIEVGEAKLASYADKSLVLTGIKEETKNAIGSISCLMLSCVGLVSLISGKDVLWNEMLRLPEILQKHLKEWQSRAQQIVQSKPSHIVFLGSGPFYGVAGLGSALVAKMAGLPCEHDYFIEYRQANYASLTNLMMVVGLVSNTFRAAEEKVMGDLAVTRANRVAISEDAGSNLMKRCEELFELKSGVSEIARVLLVIPVMQLLAFYVTMSRGVNPDNPKHLDHPELVLRERPGAK